MSFNIFIWMGNLFSTKKIIISSSLIMHNNTMEPKLAFAKIKTKARRPLEEMNVDKEHKKKALCYLCHSWASRRSSPREWWTKALLLTKHFLLARRWVESSYPFCRGVGTHSFRMHNVVSNTIFSAMYLQTPNHIQLSTSIPTRCELLAPIGTSVQTINY